MGTDLPDADIFSCTDACGVCDTTLIYGILAYTRYFLRRYLPYAYEHITGQKIIVDHAVCADNNTDYGIAYEKRHQ